MSKSHYFQVNGMTCAGCETTIQKVVGDLNQVEMCAASHRWNLLEVRLKPNTNPSLNKIIEEVSTVGFEIQAIPSLDAVFKGGVKHQSKTKHYLVNGSINVGVGLLCMLLNPYFVGLNLALSVLVNVCVFGVMLWTGREFYQDAWAKLKVKRSSMNSLIALSTLTAWATSMLGVLLPSLFASNAFAFMPIFMILGITNLGRMIRSYHETKAFGLMQGFDSLFEKNQPKKAKKLNHYPGKLDYANVPFSLIQPKDYVLVGQGEKIPVDGLLMSNQTLMNQKVLTGESILTPMKKGDKVFAGTVNMGEPVVVQATCKGPDNTILKLLHTVRKAQLTEHANHKMDKLIQYFVPGVISFALIASAGWWTIAGPAFALNTMTSILLCACPCALGLAAPLSQAFAIYKLLHHGVLIKDADKLQSLANVDTLVFDKTGTLTEPKVAKVATEGLSRAAVLKIVASIEEPFKEKHPIACALVNASQAKTKLKCENVKLHESGQGVEGLVEGTKTTVGSLSLAQALKAKISPKLHKQLNAYQALRLSPLCVVQNGKLIATIGLKDSLKQDVAATLHQLSRSHELILLTGDNEKATKATMKGLPFDKIWTNKSANQKEAILQKINQRGKKVAYVGDGLNDLKAALNSMVSLAVLPWTQLATVADISLKSKISDLPKVIEVARVLNHNVNQNLGFNLAYNAVSLTAAAGLLAPWVGMATNPMIFSTMMALSSICVVMNASRMPWLIDSKMGNAVFPSHSQAPTPSIEYPLDKTDKHRYEAQKPSAVIPNIEKRPTLKLAL